jgi:arginine/serine-rich splicing factor 16
LIDRFDARSHLDIIEEYTGQERPNQERSVLSNEIDEERMCNYERYKTLIQNEAADISEEQCLKEIEIEEKYGPISDEKKTKQEPKATIGYVYEDSTATNSFFKKSNKNENKKFSLNDLIFDSDDDLEFG